MSIYHATTPPPGTTCQTEGCCSTALVRLVIAEPGEAPTEAPGAGASWDSCELHWPRFRDTFRRNGHGITDQTGEMSQISRDFPAWHIFTSDTGRYYAVRRINGGQGTTVDAYLAGHLRRRMAEQERAAGIGGY